MRATSHALTQRLLAACPSFSLRTVLLVLCVLPALAVALLGGGSSAVFVHRTAERQGMQAIGRDADFVAFETRHIAETLKTKARLLAERVTITHAVVTTDPRGAREALARAMDSLVQTRHSRYAVQLITSDGTLLAAAGEAPTDRYLASPTMIAELGPLLLVEMGDVPALVSAMPIIWQGRQYGTMLVAVALNGQMLQDIAGLSWGMVMLHEGRVIGGNVTVAEEELQRRFTLLGGATSGTIVLTGVRYAFLLRDLPLPGTRVQALTLWPAAELERPGNVAVGAIILSVLLVTVLVLPILAWIGARLGRRMAGLSGAIHDLSEGRRPEGQASPPLFVREFQELHNAGSTFQQRLEERERLNDHVRWLANHDALTRLPNRVLFQDRLGQGLATMRRSGTPMALMALDLDRFKEVNDTLGHAAGDALLRQVAERITLCLREVDTVARLGGDEFAVILSGIQRAEDCEATARRIIAAITQPIILDGGKADVGVSIGIAIADAETDEAEALLRDADMALYAAKESGRGTWCFFSPDMDAKARARRQLETRLRDALTNGALHIAYQPQVSLGDQRVIGAEALLRWTEADGTTHSPAVFIPLAEDTGLIVPIGAFVLREACAFAAARPGLRVAVNVSPVQLRHPAFLSHVREALAAAALPPAMLELEMTETAAYDAGPASQAALETLRAMGIGLALDDFGTGYSSLGHLRRLPVDRIKIDRSFVQDMANDEQARALVRAMVGMARAVGVGLVGEGVETADQARALLDEGCREAQGFMFGRPVSAAEFDALRVAA